MPASNLELLGRIDIPPAALDHRFFDEALACVRLMQSRGEGDNRVIGTLNTQQPELYGWAGGVQPHQDQTGWMYFCPLFIAGRSTLCCSGAGGPPQQLQLQVGGVVRLWDHATHFTMDTGPVVAMFVGSFAEPVDEGMADRFRAAAAALAGGDYYGAPRVRDGFRELLDDECLALRKEGDDFDTVLLADAKRDRRVVLPCAKCARPAVRVDNHWPYHQDGNRCRRHLRRERT